MNSDLLHSGLLGPNHLKRYRLVEKLARQVDNRCRCMMCSWTKRRNRYSSCWELGSLMIPFGNPEILKICKETVETDLPGLWLYTCEHDDLEVLQDIRRHLCFPELVRHKDEARAKVSLWGRRLVVEVVASVELWWISTCERVGWWHWFYLHFLTFQICS